MGDHLEEAAAQRWNYWKNHELVVVEEGEQVQAYYLKHPKEGRIEGCLLLFTPEGIVIMGDHIPGPKHAIASPYSYTRAWFSGNLSPSYLAGKFLDREWDGLTAADELYEDIAENGGEDGYSPKKVKELEEIASALDEDCLSEEELYEALSRVGWDVSDGCPGYDYNANHYSLLIAIQRRFAELWKERSVKLD